MDNVKNIIKNDSIIKKIIPLLKDYNFYLVGGYIRDAFWGKSSTDRDLIIECPDIKELARKIADFLNAHFIELDNENNIYRIVLDDKINYLDLTSPVENDIIKDILRRDLTLNSIVYDFQNDDFIDITGGISHIKNKIIKGISEKNFIDDPLRLLRIYRFYAQTGFDIDNELENFIKQNAHLIQIPAKERVNSELIKLFEGKYTSQTLKKMDEGNILEYIFPIIKEIKKVPPNSHHHLDLFNHSVETTAQIQKIYETSNEATASHLNQEIFNGSSRLAYLKIAAFLHDIGKPSTWIIEEGTGKHRFIKHDEEGAKLVSPLLKGLKFSKKQISYIQKLIKYHIYPSSVVTQDNVTEKAKMKFFRKMEDDVIDIIILAQADRLSARGPDIKEETVNKNINGLNSLLNKYFELKNTLEPLPRLLNGREIMEILKIQASPQLGKIIKELQEAQISGDINTKDEAVNFIISYYNN